MTPEETLALALDPARVLMAQGIDPDPWQRQLLLHNHRKILLNCCRQAGKSTTVAALALHRALFKPKSLIIILSPGQRQSGEIFRKVKNGYNAVNRPVGTLLENLSTLELANGSRIVSLPGKEATVRAFSGVELLIIDEASRVPDDLYRAVRPFLAVSGGQLILLSTPFGKRGFFFDEWDRGEAWHRVITTWHDCPRITEEFIRQETQSLGQAWVDQEYNCLFTALEGLVYPDFEQCIVDMHPLHAGRLVGGIDFGWHNPFAAVWGILDSDDVLWITHERYLRETALHEHCRYLREHGRKVLWYADPAGPTEINELRCGGLKVLKGMNEIRLGIQAVTARIRTGRLKVLSTQCFNLIDEAKLYRYPTPAERAIVGENPIDDNNHALAALRYLVSKVDARFIASLRKKTLPLTPGQIRDAEMKEDAGETVQVGEKPTGEHRWCRIDNESLWEPL